jgi:hypothetical protein
MKAKVEQTEARILRIDEEFHDATLEIEELKRQLRGAEQVQGRKDEELQERMESNFQVERQILKGLLASFFSSLSSQILILVLQQEKS